MTAPRALARALAASVFPPRCCLCGLDAEGLDLDMCDCCREDLPWTGSAGVDLTPFRYEWPIDILIRDLKYRGVIAHARVLGVLLAQAALAGGQALPRLLVPVPLHPARLRERGFNQALAIARYAGRLLEIPLAKRAVRRVRDTPSQTGLGVDARRRNVCDVFAIPGTRAWRSLVNAAHVALVDDVSTTGSTLGELRQLLLSAGVARVDRWAVAQAPPHTRDPDSSPDTPATRPPLR